MNTLTELQLAYQEFRQAAQNFNYAAPGHIDTAICNLKAAEEKIKSLRRESSESQLDKSQINYCLLSYTGRNIDICC